MRRVIKALLSNGIFSVMTLALSVLVARFGGTDELGMFGVSFAAYLLVQVIVREAGANTIVSTSPTRRKLRVTAGRISFMALVFAVPILLCGVALSAPYLTVIGLAIHGLCLYDYSKTMSLSLDDGRTAILQDGALFAVFSIAAGMAFLNIITPLMLVAVWAFSGSMLGYLSSFIQSYRLRPSWSGEARELKTSWVFGSQALIGSGSVHILTFLLSLTGGPGLVGAMRGASTIIGPSNLIVSTAQPLLITFLARSTSDPETVSMPAVRKCAVALVSVHFIVTSGLVALGHFYGDLILGATWQDSAHLLYVVALDSVFVAIGAVPLAAHRSVWAAKRLAQISMRVVIIRLPLVILGAVNWGAFGAVCGLLAVTIMASSAWWISLIRLNRR